VGADVSTVAEIDYPQFDTIEYQNWLATSPYGWKSTSYMIHSTPEAKIQDLVLAVRDRAAYLFVTDLTEGCYQSFGASWEVFVASMAKGP
jgi:hypothetical protein